MSLRYLLPCPKCSHKIELVARQAGSNIECPECQHTSEAPTLGTLKKLESIGEATGKKSGSSGLKRTLFSLGLGLAGVLGLLGFVLNDYAKSMIYELDLNDHFTEWSESLEELSPAQVMQEWDAMNVEAGLGEWYEQGFARYATQGNHLKTVAYGLYGLAGIGLLMMLGSFFVRS